MPTTITGFRVGWVHVAVPWKADAPNHGFMLRDGQRVVGVYLAFYSERVIAGRVERFCNLGAWCVLPEFRFHSVRLLKALLAQDGYHFTDLSPSEKVSAAQRQAQVPLPRHVRGARSAPAVAHSARPDEDQRRPGCHRGHAGWGGARSLPRSCTSTRRASPGADPRQRILLRDVP